MADPSTTLRHKVDAMLDVQGQLVQDGMMGVAFVGAAHNQFAFIALRDL